MFLISKSLKFIFILLLFVIIANCKEKKEERKRYDFYMLTIPNDAIVSMAYGRLANVFFYRGQYEKALESINNSIQILPNNPATLYNKAVIEIKLGKKNEAINTLKRVISVHENSKKAWYNLGVLLLEQKNYKESLKAFKNSESIIEVDSVQFMRSKEFREKGDDYWHIK
ncbi:MAG: tetratricopeptide repeat protein [Leptospiraceae bacterium]|nr:tetratricopeptide repeat protein [Leptospiraceae bacterium]MCP5494746.1 tetratricopeptide repeat protein [Leptospiraceae bacterium]